MDTRQLADVRQILTARRDEIQVDLVRLDQEMQSLGTEQGLEHGGTGNHLADDGVALWNKSGLAQ